VASFKQNLVARFVSASEPLLGSKRGKALACYLAENIQPEIEIETPAGPLLFSVPNGLVRWRATSFFTKEPETMDWISHFDNGDVLFDIGANVGIYSLWAALSRKCHVISFEPESQNFSLLCQNIGLNNLGHLIRPLNVAASDHCGLDKLVLSTTQAGGAEHGIEESSETKNYQWSQVDTIDNTIQRFDLPQPNHVKIDVDGIEPLVLNGMVNQLSGDELKTIQVEIERGSLDEKNIFAYMKNFNFHLKSKSRSELFSNTAYSKFENYLFTRSA
jgi:FkbM family methyltransferase